MSDDSRGMDEDSMAALQRRMFLALALVFGAIRAGSAAPKLTPLPTDRAIAAYVGLRGTFRSVPLDARRRLTMRVWAAAFAPGEKFDFSSLDYRAFQNLDLPAREGWGLFEATTDTLALDIRISDANHRLGSVNIFQIQPGTQLQAIPARHKDRLEARLKIDANIREYRIDILDMRGNPLAVLAVDLGKWDTVYPFSVSKNVERTILPPISSARFTIDSDQVSGVISGQNGPPRIVSCPQSGISRSASALDYRNDSGYSYTVFPPTPFDQQAKRSHIVAMGPPGISMRDSAAMGAYMKMAANAFCNDTHSALSPFSIPAYTDATVLWRIELGGRAIAFLAVPFERKRASRTFDKLMEVIEGAPSQGSVTLAAPVLNAARRFLKTPENQRTTGFLPGDLMYWADSIEITAKELSAELVRTGPILQAVTFDFHSQEGLPPNARYTEDRILDAGAAAGFDGGWAAHV